MPTNRVVSLAVTGSPGPAVESELEDIRAAAVSSVAGKTGAVTLVASDVGAAPVSHTHTPASLSALPTVTITPGSNIQTAVNANPAGTRFLLESGTHSPVAVVPKSGNVFEGRVDTVLDGTGLPINTKAFWLGTQNGTSSTYPIDVVFRRLKITNYPAGTVDVDVFGAISAGTNGYGANTSGARWVVEDCEISYNGGSGVRCGDGIQIRRCYIHHNQGYGINGAGDDVVIEGCRIEYNNPANAYNALNGAGGIKIVNAARSTVRDCKVRNNGGRGVWFDIACQSPLVERCDVLNNTHNGVMIEISYDAIVRHNNCQGNGSSRASGTTNGETWFNGAGILIAESPGCTVTGNLVKGNANAISLIQQPRSEGVEIASRPFQLRDINVSHNTIWLKDGFATGAGWCGLAVSADSGAGGIAGHYGTTGDSTNDAAAVAAYCTSMNNYFSGNTLYTQGGAGYLYFKQSFGTANGWNEWQSAGNDTNGVLRAG